MRIDYPLNVNSVLCVPVFKFAALIFNGQIIRQINGAKISSLHVPQLVKMRRTGYHGAKLSGVNHTALADYNSLRAGKNQMPADGAVFNCIDRPVDLNLIPDQIYQVLDIRLTT